MDRSIDRNEPVQNFSKPDRETERRDIPDNERPKERFDRSRLEYRVSDTQLQTMAEIGRFRTLSVEDLARYLYGGNRGKTDRDIRHLVSQNLVQQKSIWLGGDHEYLAAVTLTKQGKRFLEQSGERGIFYTGFVKSREMSHDAAIYRMYQAAAAKITKSGGVVRGTTLDYELKSRVYSSLAKEKPGTQEYKMRQQKIASEHGLKVVQGHIQLPDLRIEYMTRDGELARKDLELATHHYRGSQLAAKAAAGFTFYASGADAGRLSSVFDDHHITAEILSL